MTRFKQYLIDSLDTEISDASLLQAVLLFNLNESEINKMPDCINNINMRASGATNYFIYKA